MGEDEQFLDAWDRLRNAIGKVECALPSQLTEAVARLVANRDEMDALVASFFVRRATLSTNQENTNG